MTLLPGQHVPGTLGGVHRLHNSVNGNPRWRLTLDDGRSWTTKTDCHVGLVLTEHWAGEQVILVLDGRGQVIDAERSCRETRSSQGVVRRCQRADDGHKDHEWWGTGPDVLAGLSWGTR